MAASRWRSLSTVTSAVASANAAAAGTGRCAVYSTKRGVSGNCTFTRTSAVKKSWDSLNKKTAVLEQKLDAVDGASSLVLGNLDTTLISSGVDAQLTSWKYIGSTNCFSSSDLKTTGSDQFVRVRSHGLYTITCQLRWLLALGTIADDSQIVCIININGSTVSTGSYHPPQLNDATCIVTYSLLLNAGDEIRIYCRQFSSSAQTVLGTGGTVWTVQKH